MKLLPLLLLAGCSVAEVVEHRYETIADRAGLEERTFTAGPDTLHYSMGGQGDPLLLIHGFGGDGLGSWLPQVEDLAAQHTLIIPDLLWFGQSRSEGPATLEHQVQAMIAILDHAGVEEADVLGISYGGFVTLQLVATHPERAAQVVIVDSPGGLFGDDDVTAMCARFGVESPADLFVPDGPEDLRPLIDLCYHDPPWVPDAALDELYDRLFAQHHDEQRALLSDLTTRYGAFEDQDWRALGPWLVIWGEFDAVFPLEDGRALAEVLGAELVVIPDTAHAPCAEEPKVFNDAVLRFLAPPIAAAPAPSSP
ncbi:MAG: alpha/beta hydrolase [Alphaproteobacteria bacterium]|nr:alpha/beta hydrolase [Alphaproteobacteria bacterium]